VSEPSEVIVDTSFILPMVGVKVRGVDLRLLADKTLCYPQLMLIELLAVMVKEAKALSLQFLPQNALRGFLNVLYSGEVKILSPTPDDVQIVYDVIRSGWKDIFDAVLYATSVTTNTSALTLHRGFY
jgi:hypothetical protein